MPRLASAASLSVVSSKFQVVIPRQVRDAAGIRVGDRLAFVPWGGTLQVVKVPGLRQCVGILRDVPNTFDRDEDAGDRDL